MKTVLFDLDGTLLPLDQDVFVKAYFGGLAKKLVPYGYDPKALVAGIWAGTVAMGSNDGSMTNEEAFWKCFCGQVRPDARKDEAVFEEYYRTEFQQVRQVCGFEPRASEVIRFLKDRGCRVALATNPLFPAIATDSRVRWAGLDPADFALITTYENSTHCKPNPEYYRDILNALGETPENCIMVGNDAEEDLAAEKLGMGVFLLTDCLLNRKKLDVSGCPQGGFPELMDFLRANID
ncbi:MAG: HAD family hydrolase [Oscillospiraceae bacterium]|nr:HAD family hydrolase [Oscillospiraceae bacterium]